ncbi:hypothetical protein LVISKB_0590 [Levilactobacillus brevis KB290]|uniref:Uncharacterized protein n=1 Tax=Levilactobacillus brevis KB290 TaxID=1001583 RepID=M5ACU4_LEVBR|nr:hypothetical protein LVISKB_0590 [Levilactobacillus brevis KB290]
MSWGCDRSPEAVVRVDCGLAAAGVTTSSTIVFHSPQLGQRPK